MRFRTVFIANLEPTCTKKNASRYKNFVLNPQIFAVYKKISILIGHTIFFTREKYRITNHKPDTICFTCEENGIGFYRHFISLVTVNTNTALP